MSRRKIIYKKLGNERTIEIVTFGQIKITYLESKN